MNLAEALENCTPETRINVTLELRLARSIKIIWAWAIKHCRECPLPVKVKERLSNPEHVWVVNVPGYALSEDRGYVMRDFLGKEPRELFIQVADQLATEDKRLLMELT